LATASSYVIAMRASWSRFTRSQRTAHSNGFLGRWSRTIPHFRRSSPMRWLICTAVLLIVAGAAIVGHGQTPPRQGDPHVPAPGARGNADNVPFISGRDPKGNPVRLAKATGHVSNYSEEKVRPYTLPDPLVMASGERVTSADRWFKARRPEILKFYRDEIYGHVPAGAPKGTWGVAATDAGARGGRAGMKTGGGKRGDKPEGRRVNLTVYLPAKVSKPVPVLLSITFGFVPGGRGQAAGKGGPRPADAPEKADAKKPAAAKGLGPGGFDPVGEVLGRG